MRLIDADKLDYSVIQYLGEFCHVPLDDIINGWEKIVDTQPTAYDIEEITDQLENLRDRFDLEDFAIRGILEKSIEIVKSGGVSSKQEEA